MASAISAESRQLELDLRAALNQSAKFPEAMRMSRTIEHSVANIGQLSAFYDRWTKLEDNATYRQLCTEIRTALNWDMEGGDMQHLYVEQAELHDLDQMLIAFRATAPDTQQGGGRVGTGAGRRLWEEMVWDWSQAETEMGRYALIDKWAERTTKSGKSVYIGGYWYALKKGPDCLNLIPYDFSQIWNGPPAEDDNAQNPNGHNFKAQKQNMDLPVGCAMLLIEISRNMNIPIEQAWGKIVRLAALGNTNKDTFKTTYRSITGIDFASSQWTHVGQEGDIYMSPEKRTLNRMRECCSLIGLNTHNPGMAGIIFLKVNLEGIRLMTRILQLKDERSCFGRIKRAAHHFARATEGVRNQFNKDGNALKVEVRLKSVNLGQFNSFRGVTGVDQLRANQRQAPVQMNQYVPARISRPAPSRPAPRPPVSAQTPVVPQPAVVNPVQVQTARPQLNAAQELQQLAYQPMQQIPQMMNAQMPQQMNTQQASDHLRMLLSQGNQSPFNMMNYQPSTVGRSFPSVQVRDDNSDVHGDSFS